MYLGKIMNSPFDSFFLRFSWNICMDRHVCVCVCVCVCAQLCPTLCDPIGCSSLVSSLHRISQARILEWVAIPTPGNLPYPGIQCMSPTSPQ